MTYVAPVAECTHVDLAEVSSMKQAEVDYRVGRRRDWVIWLGVDRLIGSSVQVRILSGAILINLPDLQGENYKQFKLGKVTSKQLTGNQVTI